MKPNIRLIPGLLCFLAVWAISFAALTTFQGCTAPQQRVSFNTLYTSHVTVDGAVTAYYALVMKGQVATNDVPKVASAYREFQAAFGVALDFVQNNPNAPAPPAVQAAASKVLALTGKAP